MANGSSAEAAVTGAVSQVGVGRLHRGTAIALVILGVVTIASLWVLSVDQRLIYLISYLWFGLVYGILLQYGRFCMASAVRDLFSVNVPRMAVGVMIAVMLYSLTAAAVTAAGVSPFHPHPLGWHILIGSAIFGFGIVFAGGCASGSLYKAGEGNGGSMLVLLAISFVQAWFVSTGTWSNGLVPSSWAESAAAKGMPAQLSVTDGWFDQFMAGYIWDLSGTNVASMLGMGGTAAGAFIGNALIGAIIPSAVIILVLYAVYFRKGYLRRAGLQPGNVSWQQEAYGVWAMLTSSKKTAFAGLGLGAFAGLQMWVVGGLRDKYQIFNFGELLHKMGYNSGLSMQNTVFDPGYWYITTQEAQFGGWVMKHLGGNFDDTIFFGLENGLPNPLMNAPLLMSLGIILGAAMISLVNKEFKWKRPNLETAVFALAGGTLMGIGARLALGCNIGAFFASATNGDLTGWIFLAGMALGSYFAVRVMNWWLERKSAKEMDLDLDNM
ncbi:MAG TPA: YeeE/YedE family protein [Gammaproteobacteria bacterium]|nr:YeeE/YedE family protein [Gammaproteobacteria bacterium]